MPPFQRKKPKNPKAKRKNGQKHTINPFQEAQAARITFDANCSESNMNDMIHVFAMMTGTYSRAVPVCAWY